MPHEHHQTDDVRLLCKAIREKWAIPPDELRSGINRLLAIVQNPKSKDYVVLRAIRALQGIDALVIHAAESDCRIERQLADSLAQQQQIRDLQNQVADRPQESQPLRILIDDSAELRSSPDAVAAPDAGSTRGEEHSDDVRSA